MVFGLITETMVFSSRSFRRFFQSETTELKGIYESSLFSEKLFVERENVKESFERFLLMSESEKIKLPRNIYLLVGCKGSGKTWSLVRLSTLLEQKGKNVLFLLLRDKFWEPFISAFKVSTLKDLRDTILDLYENTGTITYVFLDSIDSLSEIETKKLFQVVKQLGGIKGVSFILSIQRGDFCFNPRFSENYGELRKYIYQFERDPITLRPISALLGIFNYREFREAKMKYKISIPSEFQDVFRYPLFMRKIYNREYKVFKTAHIYDFLELSNDLRRALHERILLIKNSKERRVPLRVFKKNLSKSVFIKLVNYCFIRIFFEDNDFYITLENFFLDTNWNI